ncbi:MAG: DUF4932 domain-containing protein [Oscillospiraceae bacterium]|nr:DUF4932 domain-containing protein [Oscillospiraceae bacterium]
MNNLISFFLIITIVLSFAGCAESELEVTNPNMASDEMSISPEPESAAVQIINHFADERYELVSLIFRLAGREERPDMDTDFQDNMLEVFNEYKNHHAVSYMKNKNNFGGYQAWEFAIHLEKTNAGFIMTENTKELFIEGLASWTPQQAEEFLVLVNDFYADTDFGNFFTSNEDYYIAQKERFVNDVHSKINFEWFEQYGFNYDNMKVVLSPISSTMWYGGSVSDADGILQTVYAKVPNCDDYSLFKQAIIHEFCHSLGNPDLLYIENNQFQKWSDDSVNIQLHPGYPFGSIMAREYITRAYTILYFVENYDINPLLLLYAEKEAGFPYIEEVYAMITDYTIIKFSGHEEIIRALLGMDFTMGEEITSVFRDGTSAIYHILYLTGEEFSTEALPGNIQFGPAVFNSETGDVIYANFYDEWYLIIDIGFIDPPNRLCMSYKLD